MKKDVKTPENRCGAVYLIDDASFRPSGWDFDNRGIKGDPDGKFPQSLEDTTGCGMKYKRDIKPQSRGCMTFEQVSSIRGGCVYYLLTNNAGDEIIKLYTKDNEFHISNGSKRYATGMAARDGLSRVKLTIDLDRKKARLYVDGRDLGEYPTAASFDCISRLEIGTVSGAPAILTPILTQIYMDYLVNEAFFSTNPGKLPDDWEFTGESLFVQEIASVGTADRLSLKIISRAKEKSSAFHCFQNASGKVVFESYLLLPAPTDGAYMALRQGENDIVKIRTKQDGFYSVDGKLLRKYTANIWQCVRIEADTAAQRALIRINGKTVGELPFARETDSFDGIEIGFVPHCDAVMWFDDVDVHIERQYEDYCPVPTPALSDEYRIGLNICSLWRNGHHRGWDSISPFEDLQPYLGYYDEGIIELADWEIKFMVENGIEYQHFCWYCPSPDLTVPIKKSRMNDALHNGFFNAKYSDMMKFNFMWENTGTNVHSLEQFKEHLWPYWVEYYFTDPRYMTMDNKPVMTIWSYGRFMDAFGKTEQGALEAMNFMKQDIKKYGFDGMIILFADGHNMAKPVFEQMARIGADGTYGYHWNKSGFDAEHQKYRMSTQQRYDVLHIVPTASVGFNNVGWAGTRSELISVDGHKQVLEYIKNSFLKKYEKDSWKSKALLISTWNEYGEGTYVMPSNVHGFGYLNNIREVFTHAGKPENLRPTEEQKERIGVLYPASRTPIRRLDYEISEPAFIPEITVKEWNFARLADTTAWRPMGGAEDFDNTRGVLSGVGIHTGASIVNHEEIGIDAQKIPVVYVRLKAQKKAGFKLYFITEEDPEWNENKAYAGRIKTAGEFADYYIDFSVVPGWTGTIKQIRIDPMNIAGKFEIAALSLMAFPAHRKLFGVEIDGFPMQFDFPPYLDADGNAVITCNPQKGIFSMLRMYHEFNRFTGGLYLASRDTEFIFRVGEKTALVNGKEETAPFALCLKDGLPVLPLNFLLDRAGYRYSLSDRKLCVTFDR